ncbi:MAG TPA: iron-containing alcohol dehydrogenase [Candidatus Methanoperedens sp.]|nr:iron-containing alcohol dehydrogenase [Candidatus Methanoperedens sp.]
MKKINNLPVIEYTNLSKLIDKRRILLISSPSALIHSKKYLSSLNIVSNLNINTANKKNIDKIALPKDNIDLCYAIGGGRVIDISRYLASKWNLEIICVPTIISTDAFLVDCTGLRENGGVTYIPSKKADKVIIDFDLIKKSNSKYNLSGCGDVLSIYTALFDWKESKENLSSSVYDVAQGILTGLISESDEIKKMSQRGLEVLITQLALEVQLCYFYGNSRPEEGGEHFFVYCLENKIGAALHGEMVCFGILITSFLQGQSVTYIKEFMDKVGINYRPKGLSASVVFETLMEMPQYIKDHHLARSVYNYYPFKKKETEIKQFISSVL